MIKVRNEISDVDEVKCDSCGLMFTSNTHNLCLTCRTGNTGGSYEDYLNSEFNEDSKELKSTAIVFILFLNTMLIWGAMLVLIDEGVSIGTLFVSSVILILTVYLDYVICKNTRYMLRKQESKREWLIKES